MGALEFDVSGFTFWDHKPALAILFGFSKVNTENQVNYEAETQDLLFCFGFSEVEPKTCVNYEP